MISLDLCNNNENEEVYQRKNYNNWENNFLRFRKHGNKNDGLNFGDYPRTSTPLFNNSSQICHGSTSYDLQKTGSIYYQKTNNCNPLFLCESNKEYAEMTVVFIDPKEKKEYNENLKKLGHHPNLFFTILAFISFLCFFIIYAYSQACWSTLSSPSSLTDHELVKEHLTEKHHILDEDISNVTDHHETLSNEPNPTGEVEVDNEVEIIADFHNLLPETRLKFLSSALPLKNSSSVLVIFDSDDSDPDEEAYVEVVDEPNY